ncbi:MAG: thioredoxin family protein, partial [Hyphococcus sp.]
MSLLKHAMAFPVFAAAAYFLWVFSNQTGSVGLAFVLSGAVLLALAGWLFENSKGEGAWALAARAASALALVFAVAPVMRIEATQAASTTAASAYGATSAVPYDADRLAQYRADGAPVFIDFTAAWCVTCQFNKLTVLKSTAVEEAFAESGTVLMVADWTVRDPEITQALESYGASGVPLYVVYPAGGANARILPLPLSKKDVVDALRQAG